MPSEYLKQGEAEIIVPLWLKVLQDAGSDYLYSRTGDNIRSHQGYMQAKGGRTLKRTIRDFAESHRKFQFPALHDMDVSRVYTVTDLRIPSPYSS